MARQSGNNPPVYTEIIEVTPEKCSSWMTKRTCNRVPLKRSNVDKFKNILRANVYAAALKILANRAAGHSWMRWTSGRLTADELQELVVKWPIPEDHILRLVGKGKQCHASATGLIVAYKIITEAWPEQVGDLFFNGIGEASREFVGRDPRAMYTNTMLSVNRGMVSRDSVQQSAQAIKAFNALVSGESIGTLKKMKLGGIKTVLDRRTGEEIQQEYLADRYPEVISQTVIPNEKWLGEDSASLFG
ncbi:hypothetical protein ACFCZV_35420 [Streptomyces hydrogenans]|uniref:hypothetical protein n=1 Tax=Streptomyces hydrogenans TaxID=1873719 RepID=UPI0035DC3C4D